MHTAWIMGFVASAVGITSGGLLAWLLKGFRRSIPTIFSICSGMILGLLTLEIFPESVHIGGIFATLAGTLLGTMLYHNFDKATHSITISTNDPQKDIFIHSGLILTLSIAIHNFPIGIALGASTKDSLAESVMSTIVLHNIPEGMAIFTPLMLAGFGIGTITLGTLIVSTPVGLGALIGETFGLGIPWLLALVLGVAIETKHD